MGVKSCNAQGDKAVRNAAILRAFHGYTMKSIAALLGLHYATVSVIVNRGDE